MNKFYFTFTNIISISLSLDPTNDIFLLQKETGFLNQNVEVNRGKMEEEFLPMGQLNLEK